MQSQANGALPHISVCICSYQRPQFLKRLLEALAEQDTGDLFTYSVVVTDNDRLRSAEPVVREFTTTSRVPVTYCVEQQQSIALARNRAVASATGDLVAFIDDDELPIRTWLLALFNACKEYSADGALGPVKPQFDEKPPEWIVKGNFYNRSSYPTGYVIDGRKGRTGNVLLRKDVFASAGDQPFRPQFRSGEDQDFFGRMIAMGYRFVWCDEAVAFEVVPPVRWKRSFLVRRALLRGSMAVFRSDFGPKEITKSIVAVPIYLLVMPIALLIGHDRFMNVTIRFFDHLGKLLALSGWNLVRDPYVTS